jgi:cell division protein FtsB
VSKKSLFKKIDFMPDWMKNPYLICIVLFALWMLFFDEHNVAVQWKRSNDLKALNEKIDYYQKNIEQTKSELIELKTNDVTKEKFAREHYYMKRDNEEVFVFIDNQPAPAQPKHWWEKFF